jgi:hypothetical protein
MPGDSHGGEKERKIQKIQKLGRKQSHVVSTDWQKGMRYIPVPAEQLVKQ